MLESFRNGLQSVASDGARDQEQKKKILTCPNGAGAAAVSSSGLVLRLLRSSRLRGSRGPSCGLRASNTRLPSNRLPRVSLSAEEEMRKV